VTSLIRSSDERAEARTVEVHWIDRIEEDRWDGGSPMTTRLGGTAWLMMFAIVTIAVVLTFSF